MKPYAGREANNTLILLPWLQEVKQLADECHLCWREVAPHWQLCLHCDLRLAARCLGCDIPLPPAGAYACPHCGLPLPQMTV